MFAVNFFFSRLTGSLSIENVCSAKGWSMGSYLLLIISAVLVNNFVLTRFLGICPFLGVSKDLPTALGMSGAVVFVITCASAVTWLALNLSRKASWLTRTPCSSRAA